MWEFSARTEELDLERKKAPQYLLYSGLDKPFAVDKWRRQAASLQCWGVSQVMELSRNLPELPLRMKFSEEIKWRHQVKYRRAHQANLQNTVHPRTAISVVFRELFS